MPATIFTKGLLEAMKEYDLTESTLLTWDQKAEWEMEGRRIRVMPLWEFLLE